MMRNVLSLVITIAIQNWWKEWNIVVQIKSASDNSHVTIVRNTSATTGAEKEEQTSKLHMEKNLLVLTFSEAVRSALQWLSTWTED